jgi:hypothetical protein
MQALLVVLLCMGPIAPARASAETPPDVLRGERYDGRAPQPSTRAALLAVPRLVLAVPRLVVRGLGAVAKPVMEWNEREHAYQHVLAALTAKDGREGVRPVFHYELAFRPSAGIVYFNHRLPHGTQASVSTEIGGLETFIQNARVTVPLARERVTLAVEARYRRRDDELYTGIGMNAELPRARYAVDEADVESRVALRPRRALRLEVGADLGLRRFADGHAYDGDRPIGEVYCVRLLDGRCRTGAIDEAQVPGFADGTQFARGRAALAVDSRQDEAGSGVMLDLGAAYTRGLGRDRASYLRVHGHAGTALEIWRHRTLYVGLSADDLFAFGSAPIPFSELVVLGGSDDLRGFARGQFRGGAALRGSNEKIWPVWMWMDGSVFADYGGAFGPDFRGLSFADMRPDIGFGLRVHSHKKFILRIQVAYGFGDDGGFRLVIAGNGNPT